MYRFNTHLTRLLNIDIPLIQAPIGGQASPQLAAAVSNAGGLGMISVGWRDPDGIRQAIRETKALTDRLFGVNLVLDVPQEERLKICLEEGVELVSLFWGDATSYVDQVHGAGALLMQTVASADEAARISDAGVDILVAQGWESGGHVWGDVATMPLVPRVVHAAPGKPVIAAGGITDGRGFAAALTLGAAGIWIGTRFLASEEALVHPQYRKNIVSATETDTLLGTVFDSDWRDANSRTLRNSTVDRWEEAGRPAWGARPGENELIATAPDGSSILRYSPASPTADVTGQIDEMALYAGQGVGLVERVQSAGDIVIEMADGAAQALVATRKLIESND